MRLTILCGTAALLIGTSGAAAQDKLPSHAEAVAAIRKLGGDVKVDADQPGAPVSITLTGARSPTECVPYLERINNLHTCDL